MAKIGLTIGDGEGRGEGDEIRWVRVFPDGPGSYEIPYFQTEPDLDLGVTEWPAAGDGVEWEVCDRSGGNRRAGRLTRGERGVRLTGLAPAEYELRIRWAEGCSVRVAPIGIGTGVAALGDSITEGYWGRGYGIEPDRLWSGRFPAESCSRDGRNFPQYAPTASVHAPGTTCFESWLTRLNDRLTAAWGRPVFIANEGWGGYTTRDYLRLMETDGQWAARLRRLAPQVWLIHLGVNDERAHRPAAEFGADLRRMVERICRDGKADPKRIYVARPCYDYWERAEEFLTAYIAEIDRIRADYGMPEGPDFYAAYATDRARWYGADPVHPNPEGMARMADLWAQRLT